MLSRIFGVLDTPLGYGGLTLGNLIIFLAILLIAAFAGRMITVNLKKNLSDKLPKNDLEMISKIVYYLILVVALFVALPYLDMDISGLFVAGGIFALVIGFASQSVVSNFVSGLFLMVERPVKIGDNIEVAGIKGFVEDIYVLSTVIRTYDGTYMRIPNESVFTSNITNYVANAARRFQYSIGIRYEDDADRAIAIISDLIRAHPFALDTPAPSVFVDELGDNAVIISVRIWAPSENWWDVKTDLLWKIKVALEEAGIHVPFPQRTLWLPEEVRLKVGRGSGAEPDPTVRQ